MERRTLVFVVLSLIIWYGWLQLFPPDVPEDPALVENTDSSRSSQDNEAVAAPVASNPTPRAQEPAGEEMRRPFSQCGSNGEWSSYGGGVSDLTLQAFKSPFTITPIYSWIMGGFGEWKPYGEDPGPARLLTPKGAAFAVGVGSVNTAPVELSGAPERATGEVDHLSVVQSITSSDDKPCVVNLSYEWTNAGSTPYKGAVWLAVHDALPKLNTGMMARYSSQTAVTALVDGGVNHLSGFDELTEPEALEGPVGYFGIGDRYFAALAVPAEPHGTVYKTRRVQNDATLDGLHWVVDVDLAPGETHREEMKLFIGQKDVDVLYEIDERLGNAVELGWFSFFANPLLWMLKLYHAAIGNWGLSIIALTLTMKLLFFPLTQSGFKSGQAMQAIQPMMKEINEKYADNAEEKNRRTMELFKENGVNPLGGCLPMILQMPVWLALYNVLLSSVELYQTKFLYLQDLSSQDPYGILPLMVVGVFFLQSQFTPTAPNMDPMQAKMMKFMPMMFGLIFFTLPAGLVIYMFLNTVLSVSQQWYIRRTFAPATEAVAVV